MRPQEGLFHPPGGFSALGVWRPGRWSAAPRVREATAEVHGELLERKVLVQLRQGGEGRLAFLATSSDPARFHHALATPPRQATPVGGGLYLAPSLDWLQHAAGALSREAAS